mmetsp:Transcript_42595/g.70851  ORF Transcript_42595/g.70851 Transcript_42595/m.70851 type:complete len:104 (-) Transcript_42595:368-679(-)
MHDAAERGDIQRAKQLRPAAKKFTYEETFHERFHNKRLTWDLRDCQHGGAPKRLKHSRWPSRPPSTSLNIDAVLSFAGSIDQLDSTGQPIVARFSHTCEDNCL